MGLLDEAMGLYEQPGVKAAVGLIPGLGNVQSGAEAVSALQQRRYGEAGLNALGVLPGVGVLGMIKPGGLERARAVLEAVSRGERPAAIDLARLSQKQFSDMNAARRVHGQPEFLTPDVIYNGRHHLASRSGKDGDSINEMLKQLEMSLSDDAVVVPHKRGPALQSPVARINERGERVFDYGVLEGGGQRPAWLYSAYGRNKGPFSPLVGQSESTPFGASEPVLLPASPRHSVEKDDNRLRQRVAPGQAVAVRKGYPLAFPPGILGAGAPAQPAIDAATGTADYRSGIGPGQAAAVRSVFPLTGDVGGPLGLLMEDVWR